MSSDSVSTDSTRLEEAIDSLRSLSIETLTGETTAEYAVDGKAPRVVARPASPQGISEVMAVANEHGLSVSPLGGRTRTRLGNLPESLDLAIDVTGVDQAPAHNAADLTATVEAGITVSRLQEILAEHGQFLAIDPPLPDRATIGGTLAVGWSGPATWQNWSPRDVVIGMRTVQANGTVTKSGGQVVKNVSGYDMARMHIGAMGTLGIIAEVSFKLTPLPARQATVLGAFDSHGNCLDAALDVFGSSLVPLAITTLHGEGIRALPDDSSAGHSYLAVRVGGRAKSVQRQTDDLAAIYRRSDAKAIQAVDDNDAASTWRRIGDFGWDDETTPSAGIRASVLPSDVSRLVGSVLSASDSHGLRLRDHHTDGARCRGHVLVRGWRRPLDRDDSSGDLPNRESGTGSRRDGGHHARTVSNQGVSRRMGRADFRHRHDAQSQAAVRPETTAQSRSIHGWHLMTWTEPTVAHPTFSGPDGPREEDLYKCVHCGFCLQACPTYLETGLETESPRGRIALMKAVNEGRIGITPEVYRHWDLCIQCRACEVACPSGVPYGNLIEATMSEVGRRRKSGFLSRIVGNFVLNSIIPKQGRLELVASLLRLYKRSGLQSAVRKTKILATLAPSLAELEMSSPTMSKRRFRARGQVYPAQGDDAGKSGHAVGVRDAPDARA